MDRNLESYVKVYHDWIHPDVCKQTVKELQNIEWKPHNYDVGAELDISFQEIGTRELLMDAAWNGYKRYIDDLYFTWFHDWKGFTGIRFNRYETGKGVGTHCDHILLADDQFVGVPTMSFVALLNDDYEGGDLIFFNDTKIELKVGSIVVFPSNFLFPHGVTPVTYGTRYSCATWSY